MKITLLLFTLFTLNSTIYSQDYLWSLSYGNTLSEVPSKFAVNSQSDIISTGYYFGDIDLDPSLTNASNFTNNGSRDIFIQKLNAQGDFIWGKSIGSTGQDVGNNIITDNSDNIYILGTFEGTVNFDPSGAGATVTSNGSRDIYLLKLNSNGDFNWVKTIGNTGNENSYSIAIDDNNNIYLTGVFEGTVDFGIGTTPKLESSMGSTDSFVLKLDNNGDYIWVNTYGSISQDYSGEIMINNTNEVYIAGGFANTVDFEYGPGSTTMTSGGGFFGLDSYLLKLNYLGDFVWVKNTASSVGDVFVMQTKMDDMGNIYNVGSIEDVTDFDPSANIEDASTSTSTSTSFIQKLNSDGDLLWAKLNGNINAVRSTFTNSNNLLLVGEFTGTVDFDLGINTFNLTPVNSLYAAFFQTINSSGDFINANYIDGYNNLLGHYLFKDLKYLNDGDILYYGNFSGTIDLNISPNEFNTVTSPSGNDVFLLKQTNFDVGVKTNSLDFSVYPNPSTGKISIETSSNNSTLYVYDINGKQVFSDKIQKNYTFNLDKSPGVYFIEIRSEKFTKKMKLIKL